LVVIFVEVKEQIYQGIVDKRKICNDKIAPEMSTRCGLFCNIIGYKNDLTPNRKRFPLMGPGNFWAIALKSRIITYKRNTFTSV
jgi:hypothetical protein